MFTVIKAVIFTLVIIMFLQIKWGHNTLEDRAMIFIRNSDWTEPFRKTSQRALIAVKQGTSVAAEKVKKKAVSLWEGDDDFEPSGLKPKVEKGQAYMEKKASELKERWSSEDEEDLGEDRN